MQVYFPNESPYLFCGANPNLFVDPDGRRKYVIHRFINEKTGVITEIRIPKSNELKREPVYRTVSHGSGSTSYTTQEFHIGYYDIEEIHTHTIKSDGTFVENVYTQIGKLRKVDPFFDNEWWVNLVIGDGGGGIRFTSSNGKGKESRTGELADSDKENLDLVLSGLQAAKNAEEAQAFSNYIEAIVSGKTKLGKVKDVLETILQIQDRFDAAYDIGTNLSDGLEASKPTLKKLKDVIITRFTSGQSATVVITSASNDKPDTVIKFVNQGKTGANDRQKSKSDNKH